MNKEREDKLNELRAKKIPAKFVVAGVGESFIESIESKVNELRETLGSGIELNNLDELVDQLEALKSFHSEVKELKESINSIDIPSDIKIVGLESLLEAAKAIAEKPEPKINVEKFDSKPITDSIDKLIAQIKVKEVRQNPSDYTPVRRVVNIGNKLIFDDGLTGSGGGGGGGFDGVLRGASGGQATVTNGKLDVNATFSGGGDASAAKQDEQTALLTTIEGNQLPDGHNVTIDNPGDIGGGTQYTEDAAAAADPVGTALNLIRKDTLAAITTTDGDNVAARGTNKGELYVKHVDTVTVDGSGVTQPISHAALTELAAAIDTEVQVDVVGALPAGNNNIGDVDVASSALPTGASTSAKQDTVIGHLDGVEGLLTTIDTDTGAIDTKLGTIDTDTGNIAAGYAAEGAALASGVLLQGDDGTDRKNINVDATTGDVQVDVTNTVTVDGSGVTQPVSHAALTELAAAIDTEVQTDIVGALPAGTNNIGDVDIASIAAGDNNIGNVDVASIAAGDNNIGNVDIVTLPATPAGTNAIGKMLPPDVDVTAHTNYAKKYYTNAGAVTDGIVWSPAAGKRWHVVSLIINVSAAATVTLEDDKSGGDEAVMKMELAANSGVAYNFSEMYPLSSGEDAADLIVTTSAGNVYITVTGYEI